MTLTIGRATLTTGPYDLRQVGDRFQFRVDIDATTVGTDLDHANALRQQILGIVDNVDEPVIPLTWTGDSDIDGYYRPRSARVEPVETYLDDGLMRCRLALDRVTGGWNRPTLETYLNSVVATNSHSVTAPTYAVTLAHPPSAWEAVDWSELASPGSETITDIDGTARSIYLVDGEGAVDAATRARGVPADHYAWPNCVIEVDYSGSWYAVTGRQLPKGFDNWRITNGYVMVESGPSTDGVTISVADSQVWRGYEIEFGTITASTFTGDGATLSLAGADAGPFIIRNAPETCILQVATGNVFATFTVWRGGGIVMLTIAPRRSTANIKAAIGLVSGAAGTAVTGGIRTTTTDGNGNRFVMLNRATVETDTTNTAVGVSTAADAMVFSAGVNLGAVGSGYFSEAGQLDQLCQVPAWTQRVVAR